MVNRIQIELYLVVRIKRMANRVAIVWMTMATMSKILISILNIPLKFEFFRSDAPARTASRLHEYKYRKRRE